MWTLYDYVKSKFSKEQSETAARMKDISDLIKAQKKIQHLIETLQLIAKSTREVDHILFKAMDELAKIEGPNEERAK